MARERCWPDMTCHHSTRAPYIYELASLCSIYILAFKIPEDPPAPPPPPALGRACGCLSQRTKESEGRGWMDMYTSPARMCTLSNQRAHTHTHKRRYIGSSRLHLVEQSSSETVHLTNWVRWLLLHRRCRATAHILRDCRVRPLLTTSLSPGRSCLFCSAEAFSRQILPIMLSPVLSNDSRCVSGVVTVFWFNPKTVKITQVQLYDTVLRIKLVIWYFQSFALSWFHPSVYIFWF